MASECNLRETGLERPIRQIIPTEAKHLVQFKIQDVQESYLEMGVLAFAAVDPKTLRHYARTLMLDWKPIGVIGVTPQWDGNCWAWAFLSPLAVKYRLFLTRAARVYIEKAHKALNLRRMQVSVSVDHTAALDWAEVLGFEIEGTMRFYGPSGEDCYMMSKVWDERT